MTANNTKNLEIYIKTALMRKAENLVVLDVTKLTSYADYLLICNGRSSRQVSSIAEFIKMTLKKDDISPLNFEGLKEGQWALLDYGDIVIHIFLEEIREFYDLEGLWADAKRIKTDRFITNNSNE